MNSTYAQKSSTVQKTADTKAASVLDSSAQSVSLQRKADMANNATQRAEAPRPNNTGMPDNLKAGIESLSGFSMDDVRVHYNSSKPATVQALAYTQGTDIHVAPGQEKHLPHEAWHVAQQMAGRVSPTTNINGMPVNDNAALEHEADVMGEKAVAQRKLSNESFCLDYNIIYQNCVQRMPSISSLTDYTCVEDSTKKGFVKNKSTIVRNALVFQGTKNPPTNKVNEEKVNALSAIALEAGKLGGATKDSIDENEFFQADISAKYKTRKKNKTEKLTLTYRFGKDWTGYVVKVSKEGGGQNNAVMHDDFGVVYEGKVDSRFNQYSNSHVRTGETSILDKSYRKTDPFSDSVPDAYTKLAGEGARFQCVRRNMQWINDETVFYPDTTNPKKKGVKFSDLWSTWTASFGKAYDIDDVTLSRAFDTGFRLKKKTKQGGKEITVNVGGTESNFKNRVKLDGASKVCDEKYGIPSEIVSLLRKYGIEADDCKNNRKLNISGDVSLTLGDEDIETLISIKDTNEKTVLKVVVNKFNKENKINGVDEYFCNKIAFEIIKQDGLTLKWKKIALEQAYALMRESGGSLSKKQKEEMRGKINNKVGIIKKQKEMLEKIFKNDEGMPIEMISTKECRKKLMENGNDISDRNLELFYSLIKNEFVFIYGSMIYKEKIVPQTKESPHGK